MVAGAVAHRPRRRTRRAELITITRGCRPYPERRTPNRGGCTRTVVARQKGGPIARQAPCVREVNGSQRSLHAVRLVDERQPDRDVIV